MQSFLEGAAAPAQRPARSDGLLTAEEEQALGRRVHAARLAAAALRRPDLAPGERAGLEATVAAGDVARARFAEANQRFVYTLAYRYRGLGLDLEDLVQEGNLGLLRAIEGFEPDRGLRFSTYAIWWIKQALRRGLADRGRLIRLPSGALKELARLRLTAASEGAWGDAREEVPAPRTSRADDERTAPVPQALRPVSLDATVGEGSDVTLGDQVAGDLETPEEALERAAAAELIAAALGHLLDRARRLVELRFGLVDHRPRGVREVADLLGISHVQARRLERDALRQLRRALARPS